MIKKIHAKLGNMRKVVDWVVYPGQKDGRVTIQSDKRIAVFSTRPDGEIPPGKVLLSKHQSGGAYFLHLSPMCGATLVDLPDDVRDAALAAQPQSGDEIGPGVYVA